MQARFEPVDLAAFTADLASVFRSAIERAGLAFEVDCPPLRAPVYVDREMWEKVVLNLLSNALKFTFDGTGQRVAAGRRTATPCCGSADTGIGIAAAEMPRLFERFHRDRTARARSNEGSGIGLALVRELVGLHGGTITAREHRGRGHHLHRAAPVRPRAPAGGERGRGRPGSRSRRSADPFLAEALRWLPGDSRPS